jgi:hypothetical protein
MGADVLGMVVFGRFEQGLPKWGVRAQAGRAADMEMYEVSVIVLS